MTFLWKGNKISTLEDKNIQIVPIDKLVKAWSRSAQLVSWIRSVLHVVKGEYVIRQTEARRCSQLSTVLEQYNYELYLLLMWYIRPYSK